MKNIIITFILLFSITLSAQNEIKITKDFIRVYDLNGKKIGKGRILSCSETTLHLAVKNGENIIAVSNIGRVRTKRSSGNNMIIGSAIGTTMMALVMATAEVVSPDWEGLLPEWNVAQSALEGAVIGFAGGIVVGGITVLQKNSRTFIINGDAEKWKTFSEIFTEPLITEETGAKD